jgi:hypothetical protein
VEKTGREKYITERIYMEEAPEIGKELLHSAHADGMNEYLVLCNSDTQEKKF